MKHPKPGVDYDSTSTEDIVYYALNLKNSTLRKELDISENTKFERRGKGGFGEAVEYYFFGYTPNSRNEPDFAEADLELKVTPLKVNSSGKLIPKERLVITMINYMEVIHEKFESSTLLHKVKKILLMHYLHDSEANPFDYEFKIIHLWEVPKEDYPTIKADWQIIVDKVRQGLAHELSGSDTDYLEACTKSSDSSKRRKQPCSPIPAKPRAFALKASYVSTIVNKALDAQPITRDSSQSGFSLEQLVKAKIAPFVGATDREISERLGVEYGAGNKNLWIKLTYCMLGIRNNRASEFMKANVTVRAIRQETDGSITESMSLTPFEFNELVCEEWENSSLCSYLEETRFLFVVFAFDGSDYRLKGCTFWNMPAKLLDSSVKAGWEAIRAATIAGIKFTSSTDRNGKVLYENSLPKKADNPVIHIRPHAKLSAYRFADGREVGNVQRDASELPDGQWMTKQSFWLNNNFVSSQIEALGL
ncbi:MAG: restriction endonuclease [Coriobacteriia bacterium]|nr:restriction endonuclease [Coriobacteriia bacterium]MDR2714980.1 hypothetical protein [Coriobacteriales bacterium]